MMAEQNSRLVRQAIEEIWNGGDLDLADRVFAPDYVNHGGLIPDLVHGPEAIKTSVVLYRTAFPQFRVTVIDLLAQGPLVALRWAAHGKPPAAGVDGEPEGGAAPLLGMTFGRVRDGQIVESWTCWESGDAGDPAIVRDMRAVARWA